MKVWRPSASALQRSLNCESSCTLERLPEAPREHNAPSVKGNRIHRALELQRYGARCEDVQHQMLPTDCPGFEYVLKELPRVDPMPGFPTAEVECWLNPLSMEAELGTAGVPLPDGFYRGTADVIGICKYDGEKMPCVMDYKTGSPHFQVGADAPQLGYFAQWLWIKTEAPKVASIVFLTQDALAPRLHIWEAKDLEAFAKRFSDMEVRLSLLEADLVQPTLVKNKECIWCPSKSVCPLWTAGGSSKDNDSLKGSAQDAASPSQENTLVALPVVRESTPT